MRLTFSLSALIAIALLGSACARPQPTMLSHDTKSASTMPIQNDEIEVNERTPETIDSLEMKNGTGTTTRYSLTESGTVITGNPKNPRRLIVFSDYDCLYCRRFITSDLPWISQDSIAKDKLAIERVFVPMSARGETAARLALCAAEQEKFPEVDRWLALHAINAIDVKNFAKTIGLNLKQLTLCTTRKDLLAGNLQKAKEAGVERVPFFVLGSDSWLGLLQREELKERIESNIR